VISTKKQSFILGPVRYRPPTLKLPKESSGTWTVTANLPVSILIKSSEHLLSPENPDLLSFGTPPPNARRFVVVDKTVHDLYGDAIDAYFQAHNVEFVVVVLECTEPLKETPNLFKTLEAMESFHLNRSGEVVIGIGGGILLDIVGLAATIYRRGVDYLRIPTTLLALVDASVGVKTGINYRDRRNRLGSYFGPVAAYLDRSFLKTLPRHELVVGMGEILKMAVVKDRRLFELIEDHGPDLIDAHFQTGEIATEVINRSIQGMVEELEPNLWEKDMKRLVNFGHSFSPVIEMMSKGELAHGEAVALDVLYSCILSNERSLLSDEELMRVFHTQRNLGLPTWYPLFGDEELMLESLADTVRHRNGAQDLPIPIRIGHSIFFNNITPEEMITASNRMEELHNHGR
jgi:2-epi-5-epi-valiolone synthase